MFLFKLILWFIFLITSTVLGMMFADANNQAVSLLIVTYQTPALSLGIWIIAVLCIGACLGFLLSLIPLLWRRRCLMAQHKKIARLEKELSKLRTAAIKG